MRNSLPRSAAAESNLVRVRGLHRGLLTLLLHPTMQPYIQIRFTKEASLPPSDIVLPLTHNTTTYKQDFHTQTPKCTSNTCYCSTAATTPYHTSILTQAQTKMPSSISFSTTSTTTKGAHSIYTRPQKKQKMSITQTYFLAHSARGKLSKEAARADHDLRLLVGHANMLDSLMLDLANAEQEQERWFNKTVSGSEEEEEEQVAHVETIQEEPEMEEAEEDSDIEEDDESDSEELALTRTPSRHSPPALTMDVDSDSDDESMPPSPPQQALDTMDAKQRQAIATTSYYDTKDSSISLFDQRQPLVVAAY
jgi:hypothetical protein